MPAQDRHEGSEGSDRPISKRQSKRPAKFMFIDSSNGGVNAKPDRVVRSFVMKSARNRKSWSTRPRSPKEDDHVETRPHKQLPNRTIVEDESVPAAELWPPKDFRKDSLWDDHAATSPVSSIGSIFSSYGSNRTCDSPLSGHASPFAEYSHADYTREPAFEYHATLTHRDGFDVSFTRPLNCLPVYLDAHMQLLLDQCQQEPSNSSF